MGGRLLQRECCGRLEKVTAKSRKNDQLQNCRLRNDDAHVLDGTPKEVELSSFWVSRMWHRVGRSRGEVVIDEDRQAE